MSEQRKREYTKLPLMPHQREAARKAWGRIYFAFLMEQGTGKTLTAIAEALALYAIGEIDSMCVLAPNGVHENWVLNELPVSVPDDVACVAAYYSTHTVRERKALDRMMKVRDFGEVPPLRILTISYDSLLTEAGFKYAEKFVRSSRCYMVADESQRIKNPGSSRTRRALNLRKHARYRRISTGTAVTNSPIDAFSQFQFLDESALLGEESLVAFRARYCVLKPPQHGLLRHIAQRQARKFGKDETDKRTLDKIASRIQIVEQDAQGRPQYKNLDQLQAYVAEHSYRCLKSECLGLPDKIYQTRYFHLTKKQREVYERMEKELRYQLEDGRILITTRLVALGKLLQITSGFLLLRDGTTQYLEDNPRIELLHDQLEGETQTGVIWSQFKEEQRSISRVLKELGMEHEVVNGETPMKRRREIMKEFQDGNLQWIDAHPQTIGTGFTLTRGQLVYYYSNSYNLEARLQSEDRTHRKGTKGEVVYRDFVAIDTRDDNVVWALQHKLDVAAMINGDPDRKSRFRPESLEGEKDD